MIALGWANIGAAVAPDAALASVASAIILVLGGQGVDGVSSAIAIAIPLAVAGLVLTMFVRTLAVPVVHMMDAAAEQGWQFCPAFAGCHARFADCNSCSIAFVHPCRRSPFWIGSNAGLAD